MSWWKDEKSDKYWGDFTPTLFGKTDPEVERRNVRAIITKYFELMERVQTLLLTLITGKER